MSVSVRNRRSSASLRPRHVAVVVALSILGSTVAVGAATALVLPPVVVAGPSHVMLVAEPGSDQVRTVDIASGSISGALPVGDAPSDTAINADASRAVVVNGGDGTVTLLNLQTSTTVATSAVGAGLRSVAMAPNGALAYAVSGTDGTISSINTATGEVGAPIGIQPGPDQIAITPTGYVAYVTHPDIASVTPVHLPSRQRQAPIPVGLSPKGLAITPDGATVYVANSGSDSVTPITQSSGTPGLPIAVGKQPTQVAITPDGATAFVANTGSNSVTPISVATNTARAAIPVGYSPTSLVVSPDGRTLYAASSSANVVVPIDVATSAVAAPLSGFAGPAGLAITPDQAPVATLTVSPTSAPAGTPVTFDASGTTVAFGTVSSYTFYFGDGSAPVTTTSPTVTHTYASPAVYTTAVAATSSSGTSATTSFTGQTMSRNAPIIAGVPQAAKFASITITAGAGGVDPREHQLFVAETGSGELSASNFNGLGDPGTTESILSGAGPAGLALTSDATAAVVTNYSDDTLTPVASCIDGDGELELRPGTPISTGHQPVGVAITPSPVSTTATSSTWLALVAGSATNNVYRYLLTVDHAACTASAAAVAPVSSSVVPVGMSPYAIAISPTTSTAYVTNSQAGTVTPINLLNGSAGVAIPVGLNPQGLAITPDGKTVFVANNGSNSVTPIDTANNIPGPAINVGNGPHGVAISPDGTTVFVSNTGGGSVTPISVAAKQAQTAIPLGLAPTSLAVSSDGSTLFVSGYTAGAIVVVNIADKTILDTITGYNRPFGLAVTPDQAPLAELSITPSPVPAGTAVTFDASASTVRFGTIASYLWYFGDGSAPLLTTNPIVSHTYAAPGKYNTAVVTTSSGGTSHVSVFTGQTSSRYSPLRDGVTQAAKFAEATVVSGAGTAIPTDTAVAYIANTSASRVTPIADIPNLAPVIGVDIPAGGGPAFVGVTPDGRALAVTNYTTNTVTPVAVCPRAGGNVEFVPGAPVGTGNSPLAIAVSPVLHSQTATSKSWTTLVTDSGGSTVRKYVLTLDMTTCTASMAAAQPASAFIIPVGIAPYGVAISPDGTTAYVTNSGAGTVTPIILATSQAGLPIPVGMNPQGIAMSPDGSTVYVTNTGSDDVTPIDTMTKLPGARINVGEAPYGIVITPDGSKAYVANSGEATLSVITLADGSVADLELSGGVVPTGIALSTDGATLFVTSYGGGVVLLIDEASGITRERLEGFDSPLGVTTSVTPT